MKFARYLQETQTPEWKKAYIDYRKLKKRITAVRKAQQGLTESPTDSADDFVSQRRFSDVDADIQIEPRPTTESPRRRPTVTSPDRQSISNRSVKSRSSSEVVPDRDGSFVLVPGPGSSSHTPVRDQSRPPIRGRRTSIILRISMRNGANLRGKTGSTKLPASSSGSNSRPIEPYTVLPLHDLLAQLSPQELAFFTTLDAELDKIEAFFLDREKEMQGRTRLLQDQLNELIDHRRIFQAAHPKHIHAWQLSAPISATLTSSARKLATRLLKGGKETPPAPPPSPEPLSFYTLDTLSPQFDQNKPKQPEEHREKDVKEIATPERVLRAASPPRGRSERMGRTSRPGTAPPSRAGSLVRGLVAKVLGTGANVVKEEDLDGEKGETPIKSRAPSPIPRSLDPDEYLIAKKKLKKAVLEHYRGLEVLHNYRILNVTGFRKALKKFEKVTKIRAQYQYMTEKVEKSAFASDKSIRVMMRQMEDMYAGVFARGDKKRAMQRLRAGAQVKSHHYSTFRSGLFFGLAGPAFVDGLVKSYQTSTRDAIPGWDGLLFVYGVLLVPVVFTILVGLNLLVWSRSRINYVFIFELDVRTRLDHREYFEVPSIILAGLCYAFWLSFSQAGSPHISPETWPLIWLAFTAALMVNPFPLLFKPTRYWLARNTGKLFLSGTQRVEFTDFWLGDQFCSLIFSLSNLYLFVCVYANGLDSHWKKCGSGSRLWAVAFALAALPLFIRLVQSIKRYADSGLITHLVNGGKYASGIISYLFYFYWRHSGSGRGASFALWCLFNICYSVYASTWDLLMDWSLLRVHAPYPLLRPELVYSDSVFLYYFAIVTNVLLRFTWIMYIPSSGPSPYIRTFTCGVLEAVRRCQWNFYRLENEHLGNMDQYRATREVPLPYSFDGNGRDDDGGDDDDDDDEHK